MRRVIFFLFIASCTILALYTSAGCSGGIDQLALQNLGSEALNTCDGIGCIDEDLEEDADMDAEDLEPSSKSPISAYENMICNSSIFEVNHNSSGKLAPRQTTGGPLVSGLNLGFICGKKLTPPVMLATHEPVLPFQPIVFCGDTEIPLNNPYSSCGATSDISSHYINIPTQDFGVCVLRIDDKIVSTPFFVYRDNGPELTRHEILRTCVERFSCTPGTFRSTAIPLIEEATESAIESGDITFTVLRAVDSIIVEASDMGNLANAALVLEDVGLPVDDDIVSHNNSLMDAVITFIEDHCVE